MNQYNTMHGSPVLLSIPFAAGVGTKAGHVILVDDARNNQYVVAVRYTSEGGVPHGEWSHGHYFEYDEYNALDRLRAFTMASERLMERVEGTA